MGGHSLVGCSPVHFTYLEEAMSVLNEAIDQYLGEAADQRLARKIADKAKEAAEKLRDKAQASYAYSRPIGKAIGGLGPDDPQELSDLYKAAIRMLEKESDRSDWYDGARRAAEELQSRRMGLLQRINKMKSTDFRHA
jgi:hypothetical protein